jgi:hypothetical protein
MIAKDTLINLIPLMVRQAHHERNQKVTVHPELVEGFNQRFPKGIKRQGDKAAIDQKCAISIERQ